MPYFWVSQEDEKAWSESGLSIGEWKRLKLQERQAAALNTHPLWPVVERWLPVIFPVTDWGEQGAEFGYRADPTKGDPFQAVLLLVAPPGQIPINWSLHVSALGELIGRPVTAEELSGLLVLEGRQPEVRGGGDLAGTLRTAADVERLATVLGELRWPRPPA
ncbi:MAG TPA: hypothetical protein VG123_29775 [Streptosporangiaceae bacterium]|nr:hypothetical protein [Streptosporangiaceae bacterium]